MTSLDDAEYARLQETINRAEKALGGNPENSMSWLSASLQPVKDRMATLEDQGVLNHDSKERRKSDSATNVAIAALVAQEHRLSHAERQAYADFLRQEYFTRENFDQLDVFYADGGAWDRLSLEGKKQMSDRFWKGIERGEYRLGEAPRNVREKEMEQLAFYLQNPEKAPEVIQRMDSMAKSEFLKSHRIGDKEAALEFLDRSSLFEPSKKEKAQAASEQRELAGSGDSQDLKKTGKTTDTATELGEGSIEGRSFSDFNDTVSTSPTNLPSNQQSTGREAP